MVFQRLRLCYVPMFQVHTTKLQLYQVEEVVMSPLMLDLWGKGC
ncbi:hypothetical protein CsSME_00054191 [Camellia sinensis var. sinensis]